MQALLSVLSRLPRFLSPYSRRERPWRALQTWSGHGGQRLHTRREEKEKKEECSNIHGSHQSSGATRRGYCLSRSPLPLLLLYSIPYPFPQPQLFFSARRSCSTSEGPCTDW